MSDGAVIVKLLAAADAAVLERAGDGVFDHAVKPEFARAFLADPRSMIAVALDGGAVVGIATAFSYAHPDKPLQLFINEVGVADSHLRRGLARRLVALLLERGRQIGCAEAWVATEEENLPARALYASLAGREDAARAVVYTFPLQAGPASGEPRP